MQALVESPRFHRWLSDHAPELGGGTVAWTKLSGGSSNTMLRIQRDRGAAVLRMPANPPRADSLKALKREAQVLAALEGTQVPHARLLTYCDDLGVLDVPFVLMEFVEGWMNFDRVTPPEAFEGSEAAPRQLAFAMIDSLATLRSIDVAGSGLSDFGKPEGFLERQVPRYLKLIESYRETEQHPGRDIPGMAYVVDWLRANTPALSAVTLIHGDLGFPNVLFARQAPAQVTAIVDWEVSTLGDPLLDLGRTIFSFPGRSIGNGKNSFSDLSAYPTREDLAEHYGSLTGADVANIDYYCILSMFKLTALIEWNYARAINGRDSNGMAQKIADHILDMMRTAESMARAAG